ncbi:hypothetical protein AQUCO_00100855v1 [Aquilegia coerulea]|uniref:Uncharacterized protein n=1 Tax=Aquilegia coerulea TaxID=218851 RepID=A0A2G5FCF7_AQUCA|nr:hypothetical protein AQUCO_00100855v1 [Aquilegia coerulea]
MMMSKSSKTIIFNFTRRNLNCFSNFSTVAQLNYNIRTTVNQGQCHKALLLFRQMKQLDLQPDNLTFPFISKACAKLSNLQYSKIIHTHVFKSPFLYDIFVGTAMVDMYVKCNQLDLALKIFDRMPEKDVASWNVMIMGVSQLDFMDKVMCLFVQMRLQDIKPDSITVIGLIQSSSNAKNLYMVHAVHCFGIQNGTYADVSVGNTLISSYSKCDDLVSAEKVFSEISVYMRTVISWNSMIAGYSHLEKFIKAIELYQKMCREGVQPDLSTILSLLSSIVQPEMLLQGKLLHCHGIKLGFDSNVSVVNTLISMYSKCAEIDYARFLFNSMCERTCVSWTAMISGYAEKGDVNEAFALFHAMEETTEKPDVVTMVALLSACGQTGSLEHGRWINKYAILNGFQDNIMVCNVLIDMYSKCGSMTEAGEIFRNMPERTIISWTSMIAGYALNGNFEEALSLFYHMVKSGSKPNHITFLAVLQACTHGGNLEKGQECFTLITDVYNINPILEHYACMADLLGRRGKLKEALKFIQNMPMEPDAGVWGALLGACRIHNDIEIGKLAAHHLFKLEPKAAVSYVAMANIYAAEGEWENVAKVRAMMKGNRLRKSPGQSSVEANGKIHSFTVEDRSHPEGLLIYEVLDGLALHFKGVVIELYETCILD